MVAAPVDVRRAERATLRMAIPSKGRMAEDTLQLLKVLFRQCYLGLAVLRYALTQRRPLCSVQDCQLNVYKPNPRQYIATISQVCSRPLPVFGVCRSDRGHPL